MPALQNKHDLLILFGSQTGQADAISEEIFDKVVKRNINALRYPLGDQDKKFSIEKERLVIIVCSTTGEGEAPDNAGKFVRRIKRRTLPSDHLSTLKFALLALGDTNYSSFCQCGRSIDKRLQDLGASHFFETGLADDACGLEVVAEPWIDGVLDAVERELSIKNNQTCSEIIPFDCGLEVDETAMNALNLKMSDQNNPVNCTIDNFLDSETTKNTKVEDNSTDMLNDKKHSNHKQPKDSVEIYSVNTNGPIEDEIRKSNDQTDAGQLTSEEISNVEISNDGQPCLRYSIPPLSASALKVPAPPESYLSVLFLDNDVETSVSHVEHPNAGTLVQDVPVTYTRCLTNDPMVKKALEIQLDTSETGFKYQPGDSFGIVCRNRKREVDFLLKRLGTENEADRQMTLEVSADTKKKAAKLPEYISLPSTIRKILTENLDFRSVPRKALLRMLVDFTTDASEKRRLQELCSVQGTKDYTSFVRQNLTGLVEILRTFHSCNPPIARLFELLPRLLPREYSVASSPLENENCIRFVFNVIELPNFNGEQRGGLCTKWLESLHNARKDDDQEAIDELISHLHISQQKVSVYMRRATPFRFPADFSQPLIMIGPGTGVAPFIGFLQHRRRMVKQVADTTLGEAHLFFGCRYEQKDFLYKDELQDFLEDGTLTKLYTCFSRDPPDDQSDCELRYVQHNIVKHRDDVMRLLFEHNAAVFICGDAKFMGRDVTNTFVDLIGSEKHVTKVEALQILSDLREKGQFLEDVWT